MFSKRLLLSLAATVLLGLIGATAQAQADGIVIPHEPCPEDADCPPPCFDRRCFVPYLPIKYHRVEVDIRDQVAEVRVDQAFENPGDTALEATYVFPLPEDAAISDFTMLVDGEQLEGRLLDRDEARRIYEEIVSAQRDPALLEYVDRGVFQASVFPIPPHGERRIQISYTQVIEREHGLLRFHYPLSTEKFSPEPIPEVAVTANIESTQAIRNVYSPSHDVAITREGEHTATASLEMTDATPRTDFELVYSTSEDDIGLNLLTYRVGDEPGYFLLLVSPKVEVESDEVEPKDVVIVLDTSGSMEGEKMEQAKEAAAYIVERLNPDDRFGLIAFNSKLWLSHEGLLDAGDGRDEALDFIDDLHARGSTNIHDALLAALDQLSDGERPSLILFLTDGLPTVGITDPAAIVDAVGSAATESVRLFNFGVGYDVNAILLDDLAQRHHGLSEYVGPGEDVFTAVSGFYESVSDPVLTDISLDFGRLSVSDVYPNPLPDLFAGSQLVVAGRYRDSGTVDVTLTGSLEGATKEFTFPDQSFPAQSTDDGNVPRLWATRKIGFLLNSVRFNGANDEVVDEIIELSKRFGIITPYTSFLVEEPDLSEDEAGLYFERRSVPDLAPAAGAPSSGEQAFEAAKRMGDLSNAVSGYGAAGEYAEVRAVGDKTFLLNGDVWTDTAYADGPTAKIGFATENYFDVLRERPDWGAYFALGENVIFVSDGRAYEVAEGDFPDVDVPAQPAQDDPEPTPLPLVSTAALAQEESNGGSFPWTAVAAGGGVAAALLLAGAWVWRSRRTSDGKSAG